MLDDLQKSFPDLEWKVIENEDGLIYSFEDGSGLGVFVSEDAVLDSVWNLHVYNKSYNVLCKYLGNKDKIIKAISRFLKHPPVSFTNYILKDITGSINKLRRIADTDPSDEILETIKTLNKLKKKYNKLGKEYGMSKHTIRKPKKSNRKINF